MLTGNAATVLANLDWLMLHLDMKLDYAAGVVRNKEGEPEFTLADLATIGLTPATEPIVMWLNPALWDAAALIGKEVRIRLTTDSCYVSAIGASVHGPGCPHTP